MSPRLDLCPPAPGKDPGPSRGCSSPAQARPLCRLTFVLSLLFPALFWLRNQPHPCHPPWGHLAAPSVPAGPPQLLSPAVPSSPSAAAPSPSRPLSDSPGSCRALGRVRPSIPCPFLQPLAPLSLAWGARLSRSWDGGTGLAPGPRGRVGTAGGVHRAPGGV